MSGVESCCCHDLGDECAYDWPEQHIHRCLPAALDLGGHCPDDGCGGWCWTNPTAALADPETETDRSEDEHGR